MARPKNKSKLVIDSKQEQTIKVDIDNDELGSYIKGQADTTRVKAEEKELFSIDEAANYMSISTDTVRLWIDHGHLSTRLDGVIEKVTFDSMIKCRIKGNHFHTLPKKDLLRPDEVAYWLSLSRRTIYDWIDSGKIDAVNVGPNNTIRIKREEAEKMIRLKDE